ncbi:glycogen debranching protein GlgX [Synechococcus elongatus IITB7]|uniref:glycogen debranching protein GlgX n=1 Tax=Synechococcus elongatus TaxID=32046 RepID=UPI0030D1FF03
MTVSSRRSASTVAVDPGQSYPLGATVYPTGVNFSLYSKYATGVELLLFDDPEAAQPQRTVRLDPHLNRTSFYWHVFIPGLRSGQVYAYRVFGPYAPDRGLCFNPNKVLLDPYARAVVGWQHYSREAAIKPSNNCAQALRGVVVDPTDYDWEGDRHPRTPYARTVIYELHVGGFTKHPNSGVAPEKRGTYAGLIEKIPYLQSLGVTAVELLPVHQFDRQDAPLGRENYWGYSTMAFFAPHAAYSSRHDPLGPVDEFRDLVKALHKAGIEVILDVVFNHTAEGNEDGPTLSFKGLANSTYYLLDEEAGYRNYTGCGNTVKANNSIVRALILDCLRYWVSEMHVDGFRFDLASVLSRDADGNPLSDPPLLWAIDSDPVLAGTKLIAEAWDAAGLYQVGTFIGDRFGTWNGPFRDDVRRFWRGDQGCSYALSQRLLGSPDIYSKDQWYAGRTINFVTCHDGFTLHDLVSYSHKHNWANGEQNRDGTNDNYSWNYGHEGETTDPTVLSLRERQQRNLLATLFLAQGTPMLTMGDEVKRSQQGNNNAYCQDNEISWFDWSLCDRHADFLAFSRRLIELSQSLVMFQQNELLQNEPHPRRPYAIWHGVKLKQPDWALWSHSLAVSLCHPREQEWLYLAFNAYWEDLRFQLPRPPRGRVWYRLLDTSLPNLEACHLPDEAKPCLRRDYTVPARSLLLLMARD